MKKLRSFMKKGGFSPFSIKGCFLKRIPSLLFIVPIMCLLLSIHSVNAKDKPIELSYGSYIPESSMHSEQDRLWAAELEKRSKGRVKVTRWHFGGAICGGSEQMGCIAQGLIDIGFTSANYNPAGLRLATITDIPYLSSVPGADVKARADLYETHSAFRNEFRDQGLEVLSFHPTAVMIFGFTKRKAIQSTADMKGIRAWAFGAVAEIMREMGMTPVGMPIGEVYESMARGIADGYCLPLWYIVPSKFCELTATVIDPMFGCAASPFLAMSKSRYDSLPADIRKIIEDLRQEQIVPEVRILEKHEDQALEALRKEVPDLKYLKFSDRAVSEWRKQSRPEEMFEKLIKEREPRSPQARDFFRQYQALVKKYDPEMGRHYKSPFVKLNAREID